MLDSGIKRRPRKGRGGERVLRERVSGRANWSADGNSDKGAEAEKRWLGADKSKCQGLNIMT